MHCRTVDLLPKSIAFFINKYNIPTSVFIGKWLFMPDDAIDFAVVVGKPIKPPKKVSSEDANADPTSDEVDCYHKMVIDGYIALFNKYKGKTAFS